MSSLSKDSFLLSSIAAKYHMGRVEAFANLAPCPKCGGLAGHSHQDCMIGDDYFCKCIIQCTVCGFKIQRYDVLHCLEQAEKWNKSNNEKEKE